MGFICLFYIIVNIVSFLDMSRFGRAALTVGSISLDYRRSIYSDEAVSLFESNRPGILITYQNMLHFFLSLL